MNSSATGAFLIPIILLCGALQAMGPPMNGQLRISLVNPWVATLVSFGLIMALFVIVAAVFPRPLPTAEGLANMPWWAPLGGIIGAFAVVAGLLFVDKVGAGLFAALTVSANLVMSVIIDQFGLLGVAQHSTSPLRAVGVLVLIAGVALITMF
ncbi:putative membrane spanning protein [Beijerinckiaceae bacterium RH AL1]|jgi:bacterial/archaeal transporter family-2 protein|nr:DMT family transporter [Beijerinckiaceae bacterium]VVB46816.1 putative membrane spanning protein [Beijerinckiaceae bacterium RH CH11]VVB46899.1 putative membrane spanning protein [Beijerinckiaceae bacterium RH AL8]VVC55573.1 putative membrane spanning protein [Beijerinckiaceae bacterium RH AL1]